MVYLESLAANRFICVERNDSDVVTVAGRLGDEGHRRVRTYDSATAAQIALTRSVRNYCHRGYRLGKQNQAMIEAIAAQPQDIGRYLVYGDWLLQHQDPRGELISVQSRLADPSLGAERRARLLAQQDAIFAQHADALLPRDVEVTRWRLGFAERVSIPAATFEHDGVRVKARLRWLARHPTTRFVERIELQVAPFVARFVADLVERLARADGSPTPRQLIVRTPAPRWRKQRRELAGPSGASFDVWTGPPKTPLPEEIAD